MRSLRSAVGWSGLASSDLERELIMDGKTLMGLRVAHCVGNVMTSWNRISFPIRNLLHVDIYNLRNKGHEETKTIDFQSFSSQSHFLRIQTWNLKNWYECLCLSFRLLAIHCCQRSFCHSRRKIWLSAFRGVAFIGNVPFSHDLSVLVSLDLLYEVPQSHSVRYLTLGRTLLDEGSPLHKEGYLTTHITDKRHTCQ